MKTETMSLRIIGHWGAYAGVGEGTSCYLLRSQDTAILLDCGSAALSLMQEVIEPPALTAVVLSHYHADHIADIGTLQYACRVDIDLGRRTEALPIYGHALDPHFRALTYKDAARGIDYGADSTLNIGPFTLRFQPTVHPDPCFAISVECGGKKIVYSGDSGFSEELVRFAAGADILICESSLYEQYRGRIPGHMSSGEAGTIAREGKVGTLILTHLPHFGTPALLAEEAKKEFPGSVTMARAGLSLEL